MITLFHLVELGLLGFIVWQLWHKPVVEPVEKVEKKETFAPLVLRLCDKGMNVRTEVNIHQAEAPNLYSYGGVDYRHVYVLRSGQHVYKEM